MKLVIMESDRDLVAVVEKTKKIGSVTEVFTWRGSLVVAFDDSKALLIKSRKVVEKAALPTYRCRTCDISLCHYCTYV